MSTINTELINSKKAVVNAVTNCIDLGEIQVEIQAYFDELLKIATDKLSFLEPFDIEVANLADVITWVNKIIDYIKSQIAEVQLLIAQVPITIAEFMALINSKISELGCVIP